MGGDLAVANVRNGPSQTPQCRRIFSTTSFWLRSMKAMTFIFDPHLGHSMGSVSNTRFMRAAQLEAARRPGRVGRPADVGEVARAVVPNQLGSLLPAASRRLHRSGGDAEVLGALCSRRRNFRPPVDLARGWSGNVLGTSLIVCRRRGWSTAFLSRQERVNDLDGTFLPRFVRRGFYPACFRI